MSDYLGEIRTFLGSESDLPDNFYPLTGGNIEESIYPKFALKIQKNPDYFQGFSVSDGKIHFPDWTGYYLTQKDVKGGSGELRTDTMRAITGSVHSSNGAFENPVTGAISIGDSEHRAINSDHDYHGFNSLTFNSRIGIEGQEGTSSPNVGDVTEPKNVSILYAICVSTEE